MTKEELIRNLKYTMKKHKNDKLDTFGTDIHQLCKDVLSVLEQEPTVEPQEWIPVKDRLPEEGKSVLVCFKTQDGIAMSVSERFNYERWSALCGLKPIAWMPLPSPYKGDE